MTVLQLVRVKKLITEIVKKKFHITGITDLTSSTTPLVNPATVLHELIIKFSDNKKEINRIFIKDLEYSYRLYYSRYQHIKSLQ